MTGERVVIVGTTRWGTTLAMLLGREGHNVTLLARTEAEAATFERGRVHPALGSFVFPQSLQVTADRMALREATVCCFAVPVQTVRENARRLKSYVPSTALLVSASKGVEIATGLRPTEMLAEELGDYRRCAVLSGPTLAREVAEGLPAASVIAAHEAATAERLQQLFMAPSFRVYTSKDVIGVELGGALKNVIALAAAMSDGLGYGHNARAALMTRGLAEIQRLGVALGAEVLTFSGLAGLGDLVVTCTSPLSRNYQVGYRLGQGDDLPQALAKADGIAEGVPTTRAVLRLAARADIEMPIAELLAKVLFEGLPARQAVEALMLRAPKAEMADQASLTTGSTVPRRDVQEAR